MVIADSKGCLVVCTAWTVLLLVVLSSFSCKSDPKAGTAPGDQAPIEDTSTVDKTGIEGGEAGQNNGSGAFSQHFRRLKTIQLSDQVLIGKIRFIDVDDDGAILATDLIGMQVHLFNQEGELLKSLTAEPCHPGFTMRPIQAVYAPDASILMTNGGPWGYLFKRNGECSYAVDENFTPPDKLCSTDDELYGFYTVRPEEVYIRVMDASGKGLSSFQIASPKFPNITYRMPVGGLLCSESGRIYYSDGFDPTITVYDREGGVLQVIDEAPSYFKSIDADIRHYSQPERGMPAISKALENSTILYSMFLLDEERILVQYHNQSEGDRYRIGILGTNGEWILDPEVEIETPIYLAKDGFVYTMSQAGPDQQGHIPNPSIEVYQYWTQGIGIRVATKGCHPVN